MSETLAHSPSALCGAFAEELAVVLGALLGTAGTATASLAAAEPHWHVSIAIGGEAAGELTLGMNAADAARLAGLVMGAGDAPADEAVRDLLQEVCGQAAGALSQRPVGAGLTFTVTAAVALDRGAARDADGWFQVALGDSFSPLVACWCEMDQVAAAEAEPGGTDAPRPWPTSGTETRPHSDPAHAPNLEVILDIELPMTVRFGQTEMTLDALTRLGPGSVVDLGRSPDDLVDVLVNGRLVARGEVVVASGNYGVRVTQVVSTSDRLRSMGRLRTRAADRL
jgi:flagellar motor switch protein FliN